MAGLTFLLERHYRQPGLSRAFCREGVEAFEAVGPWFLTVLCLMVMGVTVHLTTSEAPVLFYLSLTYATAISLILSSPLHTMLNRFMADKIYLAEYQPILNGLISLTLCIVAASLGISSIIVFSVSTIPLNEKIGFVSLTTLLSLFWSISSFLSSLQKERILLVLFSAGIAVTLGLFLFTDATRMIDMTLIFCVGITVPIAGGYAYILKLYLRDRIRIEWHFLKREDAVKIGLSIFFFYLGFWIDKIVFWFSKEAKADYDPLFHYFPEYDFPFFIALTIMMIGSVLVYRGVKRRINQPYKAFIFKLTNNFPFREIALEKFRLVDGISQVSSSILLIYGGIVVFILFILYLKVFPLPWANPFIFYYLLVGTIFFSLYFFYFLILQYLDEYTLLIRLNLLFLILNFCGSWLSIRAGAQYHGMGFMAASMVSALVAFVLVNTKIGGLEYHVFINALRQSRETSS
jgi:polysaccharide biosynthesis protein PelG